MSDYKTGVFSLADLVVCYAPPNLHSVMPGNKVMLRSGGPKMTVCAAMEDSTALCQWESDDGKLEQDTFKLVCLTCYGAE